MSYKYNPLLQQNLQKLQDIPEPPAPVYDSELSPTSENAVQNKVVTSAIEDTKNKKVSKFFASINEIEVGEIAEYQGETNQNFTRGFFYERKDAVTITELGSTQSYTFNKYLDAILNSELYHRQYYVSDNFTLTDDKINFLGCSIGNNTFINVIMMGVDFLKCDNLDTYIRGQRTYYVYPFAQLINGANTQIDYKNKLKVIDNKVYYKDTKLTFTQGSSGANATIGMEIDTHYLYMWIPLFPGYIAFLLDSAKLQAAYTETLSNFNIVDSLQINSLSPSVSLTVNDYEFTDQTPYVQVDTQENLIAQYFNLLSSDADAVLVSCEHWSYDNDNNPFPDINVNNIVYLKDEKKFIIATTFSNSELKLYKCVISGNIYYTIGTAIGTVEKEWILHIIYPSVSSYDLDNSMPINSWVLANYREATTTLNGFMSAADKSHLSILNSEVPDILSRLNNITITYGEWKTKTNTAARDYWEYNPPTTSRTIIHYDVEVVCLSLTGAFIVNVARAVGYIASGMCIETWAPSGNTGTFQYREVIYTI